jgi:hypothetical protein
MSPYGWATFAPIDTSRSSGDDSEQVRIRRVSVDAATLTQL